MECRLAQSQLEQLKPSNEPELLAHLRDCAECREFAEDLRIVRLLRTMPAPEPSAEFEARVLRAATSQSRACGRRESANGWKLATAASVVLAIFLALPQTAPLDQGAGLAQVAEGGVIPVTLALNSARDLAGAQIRIVMPEHLQVQGFENRRDLQWFTDLKAGTNRLTLPVQRRTGNGAQSILVEIEHNGARREFRVPVPASASPQEEANEIKTI